MLNLIGTALAVFFLYQTWKRSQMEGSGQGSRLGATHGSYSV